MPRKIVLTHFGRSGSTVLASMLKQHNHIIWLDEFFTMRWRREGTSDFSLDEILAMITAETSRVLSHHPGVLVGHEVKLINFLHNPQCNLAQYIRSTADTDEYIHIVLRRKNTLKRICSVYKAEQTKTYHIHENDSDYRAKTFKINFDNLIDYDTGQHAKTFPELIRKTIKREEKALSQFQKLDLPHLEIIYEDDIEEGPDKAYCKVLDYLHLDYIPAQIQWQKTSLGLDRELENYDRLKEQMLESEYAWMLR